MQKQCEEVPVTIHGDQIHRGVPWLRTFKAVISGPLTCPQVPGRHPRQRRSRQPWVRTVCSLRLGHRSGASHVWQDFKLISSHFPLPSFDLKWFETLELESPAIREVHTGAIIWRGCVCGLRAAVTHRLVAPLWRSAA